MENATLKERLGALLLAGIPKVTPAEHFKNEICKDMPQKPNLGLLLSSVERVPDTSIKQQDPPKKETYKAKHPLTHHNWDANVDAVHLLGRKVASLESEIDEDQFETTNRMNALEKEDQYLKAELEKIKQESWQSKLIDFLKHHPYLTCLYMVFIGVGISFGSVVKWFLGL